MPRLPIILLGGPTGVGKTAFALELARRLGTEIINADSMQVYRFMDIGTAKPTREERLAVAHHLLDVVNPDEPFDASLYADMAHPLVAALHQRGKIPLVVGGTGLYMKTLTRGICPGAPSSATERLWLLRRLKEEGLKTLHDELKEADPLLGGKIHPNDRQRILRALEVFRLTGRPLSYWQEQHRFGECRYESVKIVLSRDRKELYQRIDRRVHRMLAQGFLNEVEGLLGMGYGPGLKPMQSLGYSQLVRHLSGECSLDDAVVEIQRETRRYAKRQLTWFRGDPEFQWFHPDEGEKVMDLVGLRLESLADRQPIP